MGRLFSAAEELETDLQVPSKHMNIVKTEAQTLRQSSGLNNRAYNARMQEYNKGVNQLKIQGHKGEIPSFSDTLARSQDTGRSMIESLQIGSGGAVETVFEGGKVTSKDLVPIDGAGATGALTEAAKFKDLMGNISLYGTIASKIMAMIGKGQDDPGFKPANVAIRPEDELMPGVVG